MGQVVFQRMLWRRQSPLYLAPQCTSPSLSL
jgi:hypothetical protein